MKANRKFLNNDDEAVSPVIAVILMVAITVVLAATVYVWVSGFGAQSSQPAKSIALNSAGTIASTDCDATTAGTQICKSYIVASATNGMKYSDIALVLGGVNLGTINGAACVTSAVQTWSACAGSTARAGTGLVTAGDTIKLENTATSPSGLTLQILDPASNSVMLTLTVS